MSDTQAACGSRTLDAVGQRSLTMLSVHARIGLLSISLLFTGCVHTQPRHADFIINSDGSITRCYNIPNPFESLKAELEELK